MAIPDEHPATVEEDMPTTTLEDIECLNTVAAHALHDGDWSEADSALAEALHNLAYACPIEPTPLLRKSAPLCTTNEDDEDTLMQDADDDLTEDHQDNNSVPLEVFETGDPSPRATDIESFYPYPFTMDSSFLQEDDEDEEQDIMAAEDVEPTSNNNKRREVSSSSPASSTTFLSQEQHIRTTAVCLYNRALCHHLAWREARKTMTTTRMDEDDDDDDEFTVSPETHLRHALSYYHEAYQTLLLLDVTHIPRSDSLILVVLALSANTLACLGALGWVHQMDFWSVQLHKLVEFAGPARVPTFFAHSAFYHCAARYDMALAA